MRLSIIGSGYVGTTVAACFADLGHEVINVDINEGIVATVNAGTAPIYEHGLPERIAEHAGPDGTGRDGSKPPPSTTRCSTPASSSSVCRPHKLTTAASTSRS